MDYEVLPECLENPGSCDDWAAYDYSPDGELKLFTHSAYYVPNFDEIYVQFTIKYMQGLEGYWRPSSVPVGLVDPNNPEAGPVQPPPEPEPEPEPELPVDNTPFGTSQLVMAAAAGALLVYLLKK